MLFSVVIFHCSSFATYDVSLSLIIALLEDPTQTSHIDTKLMVNGVVIPVHSQ